MKKIACLLAIFVSILFYSCKTDANSPKNDSEKSAAAQLVKSSNSDIAKMRNSALSIIEHRKKEEPESYQIIDADMWHYDLVFGGKEISKPGEYAGHWIDFNHDFTYTYGYYDEQKGSGRFHYKQEVSHLVMLDNDESKAPEEWEAKFAGNVMVLVGRPTYEKNSRQMKLERNSQYPVK